MKLKNLTALLLTAAMTLSFAACGSTTTQETPAPEGDAAQAGEVTFTEEPAGEENAAQGGEIYVGTEAGFAPYEYVSGDQVVGVDMDIAQAIADELGKTLVIKNMDFDGALNDVQQGKVDFVAAAVSVNEERAKVMDFSDNYVDSKEVVVVNKENNPLTAVDDLSGRIVGVQQGNIADIWVSDNYADAQVKRYTKFVQAAEDLKNNKIDCIVMDLYPAQELVKANPELEILGEETPLFEDKYAIAVQKGNTQLLETINKVIADLKAEGKIEEFTANHVNQSADAQ